MDYTSVLDPYGEGWGFLWWSWEGREYSLNTLGLKNTKVWQDFLTSLGFWEKMRRIT